MLPVIAYLIAGFVTTWMVLRFGEVIPMLDLPETGWTRSFFWTIMIIVAGWFVSSLLGLAN